MKRFIIAILAALALVIVSATHVHHITEEELICQKICSTHLGACILDEKDVDRCVNKAGHCLPGCSRHAKRVDNVKWGQCEVTCGVNIAKCMITIFDLKRCGLDLGICILNCYHPSN